MLLAQLWFAATVAGGGVNTAILLLAAAPQSDKIAGVPGDSQAVLLASVDTLTGGFSNIATGVKEAGCGMRAVISSVCHISPMRQFGQNSKW